MLENAEGRSMADLRNALPQVFSSPTMSPYCADTEKYEVVERVVARFEAMAAQGEKLIGQKIRDLVTVNGVRVTVEDGTWGWCAPHPTSRGWLLWWKVRFQMKICALCLPPLTDYCRL